MVIHTTRFDRARLVRVTEELTRLEAARDSGRSGPSPGLLDKRIEDKRQELDRLSEALGLGVQQALL